MKRSTTSYAGRLTALITANAQSFAGFQDLDRDPSTAAAAAPNETGLAIVSVNTAI